MSRHHRDALDEARRQGIAHARVEYGGKHPRIVGTTDNGRELSVPFSGTPGDYRGARNWRSQLRKLTR